jgi:hypothetical protein
MNSEFRQSVEGEVVSKLTRPGGAGENSRGERSEPRVGYCKEGSPDKGASKNHSIEVIINKQLSPLRGSHKDPVFPGVRFAALPCDYGVLIASV